MAGIGDSTLFPNSKMAAAAQLGQSQFRSGEITSVSGSGGAALAPPLDGLSGVSAGWSASRKLLSTYSANSGAFYNLTAGVVDTWYDQSGSARNFSTLNVPERTAITVAGPNNRASMDFNGSSNRYDNVVLSNFFTASDGYFITSFITDRTSSNQPNVYDNDPIFCDNGGYVGLFIKAGSIYGFNWSGGNQTTAGSAVSIGTPYVVEWWHTGGNLNMRLNGGTTQTIASGNTDNLAFVFRVGFGRTGSPSYFDGRIFEMITFNAVPAAAQRDALMTNLKTWVEA